MQPPLRRRIRRCARAGRRKRCPGPSTALAASLCTLFKLWPSNALSNVHFPWCTSTHVVGTLAKLTRARPAPTTLIRLCS